MVEEHEWRARANLMDKFRVSSFTEIPPILSSTESHVTAAAAPIGWISRWNNSSCSRTSCSCNRCCLGPGYCWRLSGTSKGRPRPVGSAQGRSRWSGQTRPGRFRSGLWTHPYNNGKKLVRRSPGPDPINKIQRKIWLYIDQLHQSHDQLWLLW